jgi:shikimate kinase
VAYRREGVTRPENIDHLRRRGIVFLLEATIPDIVSRIGEDAQRPSLTGAKSPVEEVAEVLEARRPLYEKAAHHTIDTSALSAEEAARKIVRLFREATGN